MLEVELLNGNTARVRELDDIERGDIRAVYANADKDGAKITGNELSMGTFGAIQDAVMAQFIDSWTLTDRHGKAMPVDIRSIKKLKLRDYNKLLEVLQPALTQVISGEQQSTPDPSSEDDSSRSDDMD